MSFLSPKLPTPPPPPPNPSNPAAPSILEQGAAERRALAGADGAGFDGTDAGGNVAPPTNTTNAPAGGVKQILGG